MVGGPEVSSDELLNHIEALDVELPGDVMTSAYVDFDHEINLTSVAIGLELGDVLDYGERFPGVVYDADDVEETVIVVFGNGTVFVASAGNVSVQDVLEDVGERLLELGMLDGGVGPSAEFELAPKTVPVPSGYEVPKGTGMTDGRGVRVEQACPDCDYELSGEENYCPTCGHNLGSGCPDCGHELRGTENYCPDCGTAVASD
jgi:RNA polymerase subunit RPABC4/transcription elongation factor Spt4